MKKMDTYNGTFDLIFDPIVVNYGIVNFCDHSRKIKKKAKVSVDDSEFSYRVQKEFPSIIGDLIDLAVAIHVTDRLTLQDSQKEGAHIRVVLPVRHPELLNQKSLQDKLSSLLDWMTGSQWKFDFIKRLDSGRIVEQQSILFASKVPYVDEVTLWSGGLDALAGLYTRMKANNGASFMLFGTGGNNNVYARQDNVFKALRSSGIDCLSLCRVPIRLSSKSKMTCHL